MIKAMSVALLSCSALALTGCGEQQALFDVEDPERGPSEMLPSGRDPITSGDFPGGNDSIPVTEDSEWDPPLPISCGEDCLQRCEALDFQNPVNRGLCTGLWGPGGSGTPIVEEEACRRLWVDTVGRLPSRDEMADECVGRPFGEVVQERIESDAFVRLNRRHWADRLRYDTETVSVERIYDADKIVEALYQGRIAYDEFAALISAHPVLTRRLDTPEDRAEELFRLFLGRPPFGEERGDVGNLYSLWNNNYYDHPQLGMRLPDAYVQYRCIDDDGREDPETSGNCTSSSMGSVEKVILKPDARAQQMERGGLMMWSGLLTANEWEKLQAPGRLLAKGKPFWEHAAAIVARQYLDYDLTTQVPQVTEELVRYVLDHDGDIRSLHYAVLTSAAYLQSAEGNHDAKIRYTYGPLKQMDAEGWVDSLNRMAGARVDRCDFRINRPGDFLESDSPHAHALVSESDWTLGDDGEIRRSYRDLVRNLGGCPDNSSGGRFKIVSVLTTANQLNYSTRLCDPAQEGGNARVELDALLPSSLAANSAIDGEAAADIVTHQMRKFYGRSPTSEELSAATAYGEQCALGPCSAEDFARPACFALLSSAEMLFY